MEEAVTGCDQILGTGEAIGDEITWAQRMAPAQMMARMVVQGRRLWLGLCWRLWMTTWFWRWWGARGDQPRGQELV